MTTLKMKGNWNITIGKIKQIYSRLTNDDRLFARGKEEELIGRFQRQLRIGRDDLADVIGDL
jgi:uncharacterized protein YjbJ (UPF0337 family)